MNIEYAIIVKNKTRLEFLIERFNTKAQAKFYIEKQGGNFSNSKPGSGQVGRDRSLSCPWPMIFVNISNQLLNEDIVI